jgi:hypothetical protein
MEGVDGVELTPSTPWSSWKLRRSTKLYAGPIIATIGKAYRGVSG